jgi:hypothetical protein
VGVPPKMMNGQGKIPIYVLIAKQMRNKYVEIYC